jgi:LPXTG-motif cell wall-anchored protein
MEHPLPHRMGYTLFKHGTTALPSRGHRRKMGLAGLMASAALVLASTVPGMAASATPVEEECVVDVISHEAVTHEEYQYSKLDGDVTVYYLNGDGQSATLTDENWTAQIPGDPWVQIDQRTVVDFEAYDEPVYGPCPPDPDPDPDPEPDYGIGGTPYPNSSDSHHPDYWEDGTECVKYEGAAMSDNVDAYLTNDGKTVVLKVSGVVLLVVKAANTDLVNVNPVAGLPGYHAVDFKEISHYIICVGDPEDPEDPTPVEITAVPSVTPPTCEAAGKLVIPSIEHVIFAGGANGDGPGDYTITASAEEGYVLTGDVGPWNLTVLPKKTGCPATLAETGPINPWSIALLAGLSLISGVGFLTARRRLSLAPEGIS